MNEVDAIELATSSVEMVGDGLASGDTHPTSLTDAPAAEPTLVSRHSTNFWWVNQNQTYQAEVSGRFLWSPKRRADGVRHQSYEFMREVMPGDIIFSFCKTRIRAIGVARGMAESCTKPDFGDSGKSWSEEGWLVDVEFAEFDHPIRPKDVIDRIRSYLPEKYSPLQLSGNGMQSIYLAKVPRPMAAALIALIGIDYEVKLRRLYQDIDESETISDLIEQSIEGRTDIGAVKKTQLVQARRGQGVFKANVRLNEKGCRLTGVTDLLHLRASHIKPWKDSNDIEKLSGCNGLLLAPHIDHLFDRGLISFTSLGEVKISPKLDPSILSRWNISTRTNVGTFNPLQCAFLAYHLTSVFKSR